MSTEPLWVIYGLRHVDQPYLYRYVGLTTMGTDKRFSAHLQSSFSTKPKYTPKELWIRKYPKQIICEVLEVCVEDMDSLVAREMFWIAYYRELYGRFDSNRPYRCLNITDGGDGTTGWTASDETRAKMSQRRTGMKFSVSHKENLSLALRGKNTWTQGNPSWDGTRGHTSEAKEKLSEANKGSNNPMYGKTGSSSPNYGRKHSKATLDKRLETRKKSAESRAICPHCGKEGVSGGQMTRWHFDNCKHIDLPL